MKYISLALFIFAFGVSQRCSGAIDWTKSQWLKHPTAAENKCIWFRKTVEIKQTANSRLFVASLGYHQLFVNGQKADDRELAPPVSNYFERIPYVVYDVSKLLKPGKNVIAVWTGAGWAAHASFVKPSTEKKNPSLKWALRVSGLVNSDETWKCSESNVEGARVTNTYDNNGGEILDARREQPDWNTANFDDSQWENAKAVDVETKAPLVEAIIPPTKIIETYEPVKIDANNDGYTVWFPKNFTGWIEFKTSGLQSGDTVKIMTADDAENVCDFHQENRFISSGKDGETFRHRFNYAAGYKWTLRCSKPFKISGVKAHSLATGFRRIGHFKSSNDLFNRIYELDLWTFLCNTPEGVVFDCPHRERMGYGEVSTATSWGVGLPNYASKEFYENTVQNWIDVQDPSGYLPHVAPVPEHQHWGGPMWSSAGLNIAYEHYVNFGDKKVLEKAYPMAKKWLEFLAKHSPDGLLVPYQEPGKFLGDWLAPASRSEFGDVPQASYFNNCVYAWNLEEMIYICNALDKTNEAKLYAKQLSDLKAAIVKKYYHSESGIFMDGNQVQQAFALFIGMNERDAVNPALIKEQLQKAFVDKPYFDMGSSGLPALLRYIAENPKYAETAAEFLNKKTYPSYGFFLEKGETTIPEDWNSVCESKIHTCYTGIASLFIKSFAGIRPNPAHPGYKKFFITPAYIKECDWVEGQTESQYGVIKSRWERKDGKITLTVTVPPQSEAAVTLPDGSVKTVGAGEHTYIREEKSIKI